MIRCVFKVLVDAALRATEAMKLSRLAPASPTGTLLPIEVTEYISLIQRAVYATACAALLAA